MTAMKRILAVPGYLTSILLKKGVIYLISFITSYIYITFRQVLRKKRFDLYDWKADGQPEKNGFFIPAKEWELETPKKSTLLNKFSDDAFVFGTNSKSESLAVHVARIPNNQVRCSVTLRLQNGKVYSLPKEHVIQEASAEDFTFGCSRVKLQCLAPMRRWRVFFNGVLEECSHEDLPISEKYKHVKFTFLWVASTDVFDFATDTSKVMLSHSAASATSWTLLPTMFLNRIFSTFDRYEQGGMLQGTVKISNEPDKEVYLWGSRSRFLGKVSNLQNSNYTDIYGTFKNGNVMHFGTLRIPGLIKRFSYGYVMRSDGFVQPIDKLVTEKSGEITIANLCTGEKKYDVRIERIEGESTNFQKEYGGSSFVNNANMFTNHHPGGGFIFKGIATEPERVSNKKYSFPFKSLEETAIQSLLTIPFIKKQCQSSYLCGGKGSSLGKLFIMANRPQTDNKHSKFSVPNGTVVSTVSYIEFIKENSLHRSLKMFQREVWSQKQDVSQLCQKIVETVRKCILPEKVKKSIANDLKLIFGNSFLDRKFAVRSSATGEDTDQMSAAGQMDTFLGLKGIDQICAAVVKCWASQFTFQAIEYKRRYGQLLNTPMAVVIQEMVPCDTAGVIFTCDPVSGNPLFISITANWGLGESVVSGKVEPDTVTLERDVNNRLKFHSTNLGTKESKFVMDDLGTKEEKIEDSSSSCITEAEALKLGQIAIEIEKEYGSSRDLEWGMVDGNVFLFQSRPVTSLDIETDFETEHYLDSALRCEAEIITRAHVGEAMPGAMSSLGNSLMQKMTSITNAREFLRFDGSDAFPDKPYFEKGIVIAYSTIFFSLISGFFKFDEANADFSKALVVAMFGRLIDNKEIRKLAIERHSESRPFSLRKFLVGPYIYIMSYFFDVYSWWITRKYKYFRIPQKDSSAHEALMQVATYYHKTTEPLRAHMHNTFASTFWNSTILTLLAKSEGDWNNKVYSDFAYLLSTCTQVESANVPAGIQELAFTISKSTDLNSFKKMDVEEALKLLQSNSSQMGKKFEEFLQRHGHRCLKEFDVYTKVWKTNPQALVKTLQQMVNENAKAPIEKKIDSFSVIFSNLKIKLSFFERLKLRWALPNARRAVRWREFSKAFVIRIMNRIRRPLNHMAEQMVLEGRLPCQEHCFFLSIDEIRLLSKKRCPRLVARAARCFKHFKKMDKLVFDEMTSGIPKPINTEEKIPSENGFCMTGVPISQGVVKARACVAKNIKEASNIKAGDILITYSTDIGWSPYFPLLAGIVTELGGLVSHGAVVAREYGLPCVVALHGATRAFTSGDIVVLNGYKGTLQKVEE